MRINPAMGQGRRKGRVMGSVLKVLRAIRKDPNMWVRLIEKQEFRNPKQIEVKWGDDKSSKFIDIPATRGQRWINSQIIEKLCIDTNLIMDYVDFCRENGTTPKQQLELTLVEYMSFLSIPHVEKDDCGRFKPGPSSYYYLNDVVPKERKDRGVKTG